jgi:hypothetical protein
LQRSVTGSVSAASHTFSLYSAIGSGSRYVYLQVWSSNFSQQAYVNANTSTCANGGITPTVGGTYSAPSATYTVAGGFCKVSLTFTSATSDTGVVLAIRMTSGTNLNYTGDGTSSLFLWGADFK